ncbi:GGDEF domain-containing response regulator [Curvivirga aplysinae]|uniref:GGDEF domain-containing response regulator n=1 Tax=Curvivirga aplysinae TaxID=2529852 RepID=UPI0012BBE4D6|nr:diguanylate cyclase [Curvivirga aplysinae]MTI10910.1 diguanylate cyclase [Curvivirga aplysinae]
MNNVVVMDDTSIIARLVSEFLKEVEGVNPIIFTNPLEGLDYCINEPSVDMVLVDYQMPELDGLDVIEKLREHKTSDDLPVIMVTSSEEKHFLRDAFEVGANDFLRKPVDPTELMVRVKNLLAMKEMTAKLHALANTDVLTNVMTRRAFLEASESEVHRSQRYDHPMSVIMLDADHFKNVNDTYGHAGGDDVLRFLSAQCMEIVRDEDHVGRLGGEEFCISLPETDLDGAALVADRLRQSIADSDIKLSDGQVINVTVSVGVAALQKNENLDDVMRRSDEALYEAKENGRNRVMKAA